jgi:hypothetical protein
MSYKINNEVTIKGSRQDLVEKIQALAQRYYNYAMNSDELNYVFLKSVIYIEETVKEINFNLHGTSKYSGLKAHLEQLDLVKDESVKKSLDLLRKVKVFRDNLAHKLEYSVIDDPDFLKVFSIENLTPLEVQKKAVADYFQNVGHGLFYLKIGMELSENFIYYVHD